MTDQPVCDQSSTTGAIGGAGAVSPLNITSVDSGFQCCFRVLQIVGCHFVLFHHLVIVLSVLRNTTDLKRIACGRRTLVLLITYYDSLNKLSFISVLNIIINFAACHTIFWYFILFRFFFPNCLFGDIYKHYCQNYPLLCTLIVI